MSVSGLFVRGGWGRRWAEHTHNSAWRAVVGLPPVVLQHLAERRWLLLDREVGGALLRGGCGGVFVGHWCGVVCGFFWCAWFRWLVAGGVRFGSGAGEVRG